MTFSSFLTPEGIVAAGALTTAFIALIKGTFPGIDVRVSGALMAFAITGVLYAGVAASTGIATADAALTVFAAWLGCATTAVGTYSTAKHVQAVRG